MTSRPDSLNEMIHWITEDVTNDTSIALYAFEEEREQQQQQHQEASKKNNNTHEQPQNEPLVFFVFVQTGTKIHEV